MNQATCQSGSTTEVSFETVDGATGTAFVPTGSPADEVNALKTHLQYTFGCKTEDIMLEMYEKGKYVVMFETVATIVSYETVDGRTHGTTSVPTGSPADEVNALKTHLQSAFGWIRDDIVVEMIEQGKYMVLIYPVWMRFIQEVCSVKKATTDTDKTTVQEELREYIIREQIQVLDLKDFYAHYGITTICENAFDGCTSLKTIVIPDGVTTIGGYAFQTCTSLTTVDIPNSVTTIGRYAFHGCTSLTTVVIPYSVTAIAIGAFYGCRGLTTVVIPNSVTTIGDYAFNGCTSLTTVDIPNSVTTIGDFAFSDCRGLTTIAIPNSVTTIGDHAFNGCTSLSTVTIPNSVTTIGDYAFYGCTLLSTVVIPDGVTAIGGGAFNGCTSLVGHGKC